MYYRSLKQYYLHGGRSVNLETLPSIHRTGSVRGMKKLGFWPKDADVVRVGNWIYMLP